MMILAMVLLAILLALPIFMILQSWNEDLANLGQQKLPIDDTGLQAFFNDITLRHQTLFTILVVSEIVVLILFLLTFRASLKPDSKLTATSSKEDAQKT